MDPRRPSRRRPEHAGRPSLQTIASSLGISAATVSNVFNRPEMVAGPTRDKVLAEAARVGYSGPDPAARQLRRGRTDTIGLILTDEMSFAFSDQAAVGFLAGVAEACEASGRNLILLPAGEPDRAHRSSSIRTASMDGVIVYSVADNDPHLRSALERGLPVVVVDQPAPGPDWDWVGLDDLSAAFDVGRLLGEAGHRRIGVITSRLTRRRHNGPAAIGQPVSYWLRGQRLEGFLAGLADVGVDPAQVSVEERFESSEQAGADALDAILTRRPDLTAVFCLSDVLALGALHRAGELGLEVPERLSLVGFDDIAGAARVGLTTVHQPLAAKGRAAGEFVLDRLDGRQRTDPVRASTVPAGVRYLPTSLEVRRTTAGAPGRS